MASLDSNRRLVETPPRHAQVFGYKKPMANTTAPVLMNGFALTATGKQYDFVMSAFNSTTLPVLSTLATEFAVFDHWHCSSPTPTNPKCVGGRGGRGRQRPVTNRASVGCVQGLVVASSPQ